MQGHCDQTHHTKWIPWKRSDEGILHFHRVLPFTSVLSFLNLTISNGYKFVTKTNFKWPLKIHVKTLFDDI